MEQKEEEETRRSNIINTHTMKSVAVVLQAMSLVVLMVGNMSVGFVTVDAFVGTTTSTSRIRPEMTTTTTTATNGQRRRSTTIGLSTPSSSSSSTLLYSNSNTDTDTDNTTTEKEIQRPTPFFLDTKSTTHTTSESDTETNIVPSSSSSSSTSATATIINDDTTTTTTTTTTDAAQFGDVLPVRSSSSATTNVSSSSTETSVATTTTTAQFGEVMPLRRKPAATNGGEAAQFGDIMPLRSSPSNPIGGAQFGESMSLQKPTAATATVAATSNSKPELSDVERLKRRKVRNIVVAILSVIIAISDYGYKYTHPATPIQLLVQMEKNSASVETIGRNSKPTVIDFWAPWYVLSSHLTLFFYVILCVFGCDVRCVCFICVFSLF